MRAILVDDERLALQHLRRMLETEVGDVDIVGEFTTPDQVVVRAKELSPDVVFLDIQLPAMNGLHLGEQVQAAVPDVEIVFVTGFDKYAVQAFDLYALDYIMKPVQRGRLRQTVQRLREKMQLKAERCHDPMEQQICCFNQIRFQLPGQEPQVPKWRTSKAQELFAYLLHHRDQVIDRGILIELLWPDFEISRAAQQLYTTIYHIRQTLKNNGMDTVSITPSEFGGGYRLDIGEANIDTESWENQVKELDLPSIHTIVHYEHVLNQYTGDYLGEYSYLWAEPERQRLSMVWLNLARKISAFYIEQDDIKAAIRVNQRIQHILPDAEESYFVLMKLYDALGEFGNVDEQYWLLTNKVERELASSVGEEIKSWYKR